MTEGLLGEAWCAGAGKPAEQKWDGQWWALSVLNLTVNRPSNLARMQVELIEEEIIRVHGLDVVSLE